MDVIGGRIPIVEVAKSVGVLFSTESRVNNGRPNVSPKRVDAVIGAMMEADIKILVILLWRE